MEVPCLLLGEEPRIRVTRTNIHDMTLNYLSNELFYEWTFCICVLCLCVLSDQIVLSSVGMPDHYTQYGSYR